MNARPTKRGETWRIRWRDEKNVQRSESYDDYTVALRMLEAHVLETKQIRLGWRTGEPPKKTFADLCKLWEENYARYKRSGANDLSIITAHLKPALGNLPLAQINPMHVDVLRRMLADRSDKTVHNVLTLLKTMLNRAVEVDWLKQAPIIRKPKLARQGKNYRFLQSDKEIDRFLSAALAEGERVYILYATAIYTGMRAGELAALRWDDIDFSGQGMICIQASFDGPTKSGEMRRVPLFDALRGPLVRWSLKRPNEEYVFVNSRGTRLRPSDRVYQEVLHRVLEAAGFPVKMDGEKTFHHIRFHDLRHTFASHYMKTGGDLFKLQMLLGHESIKMTQRYAHLSPEAFDGEHDRFGPARTDLAAGVVVPLPKRLRSEDDPEPGEDVREGARARSSHPERTSPRTAASSRHR